MRGVTSLRQTAALVAVPSLERLPSPSYEGIFQAAASLQWFESPSYLGEPVV